MFGEETRYVCCVVFVGFVVINALPSSSQGNESSLISTLLLLFVIVVSCISIHLFFLFTPNFARVETSQEILCVF